MARTGRFAFNEIVIDPLAKENHVAWFASVKNYLIARDLWEVIDGTLPAIHKQNLDNKQDFVRWRRMNAAALHAIHISCTPESFNHIMHDSEARVAWYVLNHIYNDNPPIELPQSLLQEPLTTENYEAWFKGFRNYLIAQDLWEVIDGTFERPHQEDEDFERWTRKNDAALNEIKSSPTLEYLSHAEGVSDAKVAWHILFRAHIRLLSQPLVPQQVMAEEVDYDVGDFYKAICKNNWSDAKAFIDQHGPSALSARLNTDAYTALHVAATYGHASMVEELVALVPPQFLEIVNAAGKTPLVIAAARGEIRIVECMVNKHKDILSIPTIQWQLPVAVAISYGHKEMGRYLYSHTPLECLKPEKGIQGPLLLFRCFIAGDLDIALDLLQRCPELIFAKLEKEDSWTPVMGIASMPSAFPSGSKLVFWKRWIYHYIKIQPTIITNFAREDIEQQGQVEGVQVQDINIQQTSTTNFARVDFEQQGQGEGVQGLGLVKEISEAKWLHTQAAQILRLICINATWDNTFIVARALYRAAREGIVEFVAEVTKQDPSIVLVSRVLSGRHMFFDAVEYRQAEIFNQIHETRYKIILASRTDKQTRDTLLHVAGKLAPSSQLNDISGAAMQMQSELQWFKEVESVVPFGFRLQLNKDGMKAEDVFKESHKELRKEGEKWMKETASSCSVVSALIVTIVFAAAFTIPGGNNQDSGYPIFLKDKLFMLFIISDALSLFSSTTSLLMFLGILTSRYAEEDFLESLPGRMIIGLSTLFLSIATMMVAFSACIIIMLQHTYSWALLPIIIFASVPVTVFALLQFPLLVRMIYSTYGPSKFKKKVKSDS